MALSFVVPIGRLECPSNKYIWLVLLIYYSTSWRLLAVPSQSKFSSPTIHIKGVPGLAFLVIVEDYVSRPIKFKFSPVPRIAQIAISRTRGERMAHLECHVFRFRADLYRQR